MIECYSSQQLRARKDHKCTLCKQVIRKGQEYISVSYRDEKFRRDKYHIHCDALIGAYMETGLNCEPEGFCVEDVEDWAAEKGCTGCEKWEDACETIPLACERVLTKALKPNIAAPALESLRQSIPEACKPEKHGGGIAYARSDENG